MKAPVVIFAFNRADQLRMALNKLANAEGVGERDVIMYIDGPRNERDAIGIDEVYRLAIEYQTRGLPRMEIRRRERNYGCQKNISGAITDVLAKYGRIIVVEDDVLVSRFFLRYMDEALDLYEGDMRIWGINGHQNPYMRIPRSYPHEVYLSPRNLCTGWGTWKDRWDPVDFQIKDYMEFMSIDENRTRVENAGIDIKWMLDKHYVGKLNSWALPCTYYMIKNGLFVIEPRWSLTKNVGFGTESVHCGNVEMAWGHQAYYNVKPNLVVGLEADNEILSRFKYVYNDPRFWGRVRRKLFRIWRGLCPIHNDPCGQEAISRA